MLPCGALDHTPIDTLDADLDRVAAELVAAAGTAAAHGVELWTESLHFHRLCFNIERAQQLTSRLDQADHHVGVVMDFSHIIASGGDPVEFVDRFGPRIAHVHIRDAVPGNINLSVGNGAVDFARGLKALADCRLPRPLLAGTRNPRHHPRRTTRRGSTSRATDFRTHLKEKRMTTPTNAPPSSPAPPQTAASA